MLCVCRERGSGAIYDPRDNVSDRVVPVHADTGAVGIWWPSVTSGITKLLYRFTILYYLFYFYVTFRKDIDSMESHVLFIVSYCHLMIVGIQHSREIIVSFSQAKKLCYRYLCVYVYITVSD